MIYYDSYSPGQFCLKRRGTGEPHQKAVWWWPASASVCAAPSTQPTGLHLLYWTTPKHNGDMCSVSRCLECTLGNVESLDAMYYFLTCISFSDDFARILHIFMQKLQSVILPLGVLMTLNYAQGRGREGEKVNTFSVVQPTGWLWCTIHSCSMTHQWVVT